jgi:hypothetical protein
LAIVFHPDEFGKSLGGKFGEAFGNVRMFAEGAKFFGGGEKFGAKVGLLFGSESFKSVRDEADSVDIVGGELIFAAILFVPIRVEEEEFSKGERADGSERAGAINDAGDFFGSEQFDFGQCKTNCSDGGVFEVFARFDDLASLAAIDERGEKGGQLLDEAEDVIAGHALGRCVASDGLARVIVPVLSTSK